MKSSTNPDALRNGKPEDTERVNDALGKNENEENTEKTNPEGIESLNQGDFSRKQGRDNPSLGESHEPGTLPGAGV